MVQRVRDNLQWISAETLKYVASLWEIWRYCCIPLQSPYLGTLTSTLYCKATSSHSDSPPHQRNLLSTGRLTLSIGGAACGMHKPTTIIQLYNNVHFSVMTRLRLPGDVFPTSHGCCPLRSMSVVAVSKYIMERLSCYLRRTLMASPIYFAWPSGVEKLFNAARKDRGILERPVLMTSYSCTIAWSPR